MDMNRNASIGEDVTIGKNVIIEDDVTIGNGCFIDHNCIIRKNTRIGDNSFIGANCILGEYQYQFCKTRNDDICHPLTIGKDAIIRSGTIIYGDTKIGDSFNTGHNAIIREQTAIGDHCSVGTLCDIQGYCSIGNHVRLHSNVFVAQKTVIEDYVWIFPHAVMTNDPTPPSEDIIGSTIKEYAAIGAGSTIIPGITISKDTLVAAGSVVTKNVSENDAVAGVPAKKISDASDIKLRSTGEPAYPWRNHFKRGLPWESSTFEEWSKKNEMI